MRNRVFQALICLVVICALIFNISPIRAETVAIEATVAIEIIVVAALIALGIGVGVAHTDFDNLVGEIAGSSALQPYVQDGKSNIIQFPSGDNDGTFKWYIPFVILEIIKAFLWDSEKGVLSSPNTPPLYPAGTPFPTRYSDAPVLYTSGPAYLFYVTYDNSSYNLYLLWDKNTSTMAPCVKPDGSSYGMSSTGNVGVNDLKYKALGSGLTGYDFPVYYYPDSSIILTSLFTKIFNGLIAPVDAQILTDQDLTLNDVCPQDVPLPDHYTEWSAGQTTVTNPDGTEEVYWPIGIDGTYGENKEMTQEEAQSGEGTLELPEEDPDATTATDPATDPDTGTDTDPDTGTTTNPDSGSSTDTDINKFKLDLRSIFPFCIPFDLYQFFQILAAEPEAPVFHWEVQDLAGNTYQVDVDLSPWDSHAALFRRGEMLLFVLGLMWATRKIIKW